MLLKKLIVIFILLNFDVLSRAQTYSIAAHQIGLNKGLLKREVYSLYEDQDGLIWTGSKGGLQRYDGREFKSWTKEETHGKISNIIAIHQDDAGWLWLRNNDLKEIIFLNAYTNEIKTIEERFGNTFPLTKAEQAASYFNYYDRNFFVDSLHRLYFTADQLHQIIRYSTAHGFEKFSLSGGDGFQKAVSGGEDFKLYLIDSKNHLWLKSDSRHLVKMSTDFKILQTYLFKDDVTLSQFMEDHEKIYFHADTYLNFKMGIHAEKLINYEINGDEIIRSAFQSNRPNQLIQQKYWVDENDGWHIYNFDHTKTIATLLKKDYDRSLFDLINMPFVDSKGRTWIFGEFGLNLVSIKENKFTNYFSYVNGEDKPFNNSARGLLVDGQSIYANFELNKITAKTNKSNPKVIQIMDQSQEYPRALNKSPGDELLVGTRYNLRALDLKSNRQHTFPFPDPNYLPYLNVWSMHLVENRWWLGMIGGLAYHDQGESMVHYFKPEGDDLGFADSKCEIQTMVPDSAGMLWLCTNKGLFVFDPNIYKIINRFDAALAGDHYLPSTVFYHIYFDPAGVRWIGSSEGLIRWDPKKDSIRLFNKKDGLSNQVIYAVIEDRESHLWLSSDYGIMQFDKKTFEVNSYHVQDGISNEEFNRTSFTTDPDGRIYFGGLNGITSFNPQDFNRDKPLSTPHVLVSKVEVYDGRKLELINKTIEVNASHILDMHSLDQYIRLKVILPSYEDPDLVHYSYQLEGIDKDWNLQSNNQIQIGRLPYGSYTLKIKAQNADGHWSPNTLHYKINVIKPFYIQYWFLTLFTVVLLGTVYIFNRFRTDRLIKNQVALEAQIKSATSKIEQDKNLIESQAKELRELDQMKSRFFANVSHELRTPLTLMLGPIQSAIKSGHLDARTKEWLNTSLSGGQDLLKLINSLLDLSRLEHNKVQVENTRFNLDECLQDLIKVFQFQAEQNNIQLDVINSINPDSMIESDKSKIESILSNYLSNAFKYSSPAGVIKLKVEQIHDTLQFCVEDNGRGVHPEDLDHVFERFYQTTHKDALIEGGTGIGLSICKEFATLLNGKTWLQSTFGIGSKFYFSLPISVIQTTHPVYTEQVMDLNQSTFKFYSAKKPNVLVVEDNTSLRQYIESILSVKYNVFQARHGQEAMDLLTRHLTSEPSGSIHLIVSDIMMPVMDGYQLLVKLKEDQNFHTLPFIMLTARTDAQIKLHALRIGVDDYIIKPFDQDMFLSCIDHLLFLYFKKMNWNLESEGHPGQDRIKLNPQDQSWLKDLEDSVIKNMNNSLFSLDHIAASLNISSRTLNRKLKALTALTPAEYIKEVRMHAAKNLVTNEQIWSLKELANKVGFTDPDYFAKQYKSRFGVLPRV